MKKMLGFFVAVAVLATSSISVFADTIPAPVTAPDEGLESYTTTGTYSGFANQMMTMLVVNDEDKDGELELDDINVNTIQYIDQTTADGNGTYTFANYIPKEPLGENNYIVLVGGQSVASPFKQILEGEVVSNDYSLAGTVETIGNRTPATIKFLNSDSETVKEVTADLETGAFAISAPAGTYKLIVSKPGHLAYTKNSYTLEANVTDISYVLKAGDADGSGVISLSDLSTILSIYGVESTNEALYLASADVDDSGVISLSDLSATLANYGLEAVTE